MTPRFQVGIAGAPKPDDQWFYDKCVAIAHARQLHRKSSAILGEPIAIWNEDGEYLYLFFDGEMFKRA